MRLRLLSQNALLRVLLCVTTAMLFPKLLPPIARSAAERRLMARQASHVGDSCTAAKGLETAAAWLSEPLQRIAALSPDAARTLATHVLVTKTAAVSCLPPSDLATICAPLRFLWYARNSYSLTNDWPRTAEYCCTGDFGAGSGHFRWSLTCALAEAHLLGGRIFVYERAKCLPYMHSLESGHGDVIATLDEILDEGMLHRHGPAITEQEYRATCGRLPSATTLDFTGGNQQVLRREDVVLLRRTGPVQGLFSGTGYWYEVCDALHRRDHVPPTRNFSGVWDAVARPAGLMGLAERTVEKYAATLLRAPFVAVHVRRGDKVRDADRWPGLDAETSPPHILQVLQSHGVPTNGTVRLYVASNEPGTDFFQRPPLAGAFASVTTRHDLPELRQIADSHPHQVFFVEHMLVAHAAHIFGTFADDVVANGARQVEGHLSRLSKHGVAPGGVAPGHKTRPPPPSEAFVQWCEANQCSALGCHDGVILEYMVRGEGRVLLVGLALAAAGCVAMALRAACPMQRRASIVKGA